MTSLPGYYSFKTSLVSPFAQPTTGWTVHIFGYRDSHEFSISIPRGRNCYTFLFFYEDNYAGSVPMEPVGENSLIVFPPGAPLFYGREGAFWCHSHLAVSGTSASRVIKQSGLRVGTPLHMHDEDVFESAVLDLQHVSHGDPFVDPHAVARIMRRLVHDVAAVGVPAGPHEPHVPFCFREVRDFIVSHHDRHLCVSDLAERCHLSTSYFAAQFKEYFGVSPKELVIELRINAAKEHLRRGDPQNISDVAASVGYDDVYHFSKLFHRRTGMSPSEYRHRGETVVAE
jgi:AraC family transcriptional regulator, arabinose operon regulatory protein